MTPEENILRRNIVASGLSSAEWERIPAAIRDRAFFSSRVESARFLETARNRIADLLANRKDADGAFASRARVVADIMHAAREAGIARGTQSLTDPGSLARARVIVDTNAGLAAGYAQAELGSSLGARMAFPAQELLRFEERLKPRDWTARWAAAGGRLYAGRMVALKDDPVWTAISRFGLPYPPFDYNSGMGVEDVSYDEAVELGVIEEGYRPPEESPLQSFNKGLEADLQMPSNGSAWQRLKEAFGDQIRMVDGKAVWRQDLFKEAFETGGNFTIRLGKATAGLLEKLPDSVPAEKVAGKQLTVDQTWLTRRRKDGTDHRAHFAPLSDHPEDIPLKLSDLELLPEIWRRPDRVKAARYGRLMLEMDALDNGTYKAVVDVEDKPYLVTFYKGGDK